MVDMYCEDHHGGDHSLPCPTCREFLQYAEKRLEKCPYGKSKPTCARCPIHCYKAREREQARVIMRYAGPRIFRNHPWLAITHIADKLRPVKHPMEIRRRRRARRRSYKS